MKKDCSNIFTFAQEWERRRKENPVWADLKVLLIDEDLECRVNALQKWSDENPEKNTVLAPTRRDKFLKRFPNADIAEIDPCILDRSILSEKRCTGTSPEVCAKCHREFWDEEAEEG